MNIWLLVFGDYGDGVLCIQTFKEKQNVLLFSDFKSLEIVFKNRTFLFFVPINAEILYNYYTLNL